MKTERKLHLTLKKKWFDMIASGEKPEEYREIKEYWIKRLIIGLIGEDGRVYPTYGEISIEDFDRIKSKHFTSVIFKNGYSKDAPTMEFENPTISIGRGNPEWGAFPDKEVFIIKLGRRVR